MATYPALLTLLFLLLLAPACSPNQPTAEAPEQQKVLILTDSTAWKSDRIARLRADFTARGDRVLISGEAGETAGELGVRLPWLLQPGADVIVYDPGLAGAAGYDSLRSVLGRTGHPASLQLLPTE